MAGKMNKISYREYLRKEYITTHAPLDSEMGFYDTIKSGDVTKTIELCGESFMDKKGLGVLSKNPLQNIKYHFTISTAMIARTCIEGGLSLSESYNMSDYYIQMADVCKTLDEVSELHDEMCVNYAKKMKELKKQSVCSKPIALCMDYIYENLHTRITLDILSEKTGLTNAYLSRLFKKETGYTLSEYILSKKLETAKRMLAFSDYSIAEISESLAFPNQSYFTNLMRKDCGLTPKKYRDMNHSTLPI